jgi:quercetin dioxygenase-like cupin family protein
MPTTLKEPPMRLAPDERLEIEPYCEQVIHVAGGVLYVAVGDDEAVLTAGDSMHVGARDAARAWNAGDEPASVEVSVERALRAAA